jgi:hypothetical protein
MKALNYKEVEQNLFKNAGYRERQKLIYKDSKEINYIQDGLYLYKGVAFTYGMTGYKDYTIID